VLFVLIWWTALFVVLPFLSRPSADPDPVSGVRGTPSRPFTARALVATTLLTLVVWLACFGLARSTLLSFRHGLLAVHGNCAEDLRFCSQ
jgi:predicted secreted protein